MGQGQEIIARKYMASATVEGQWVLLQNTHLGLGYLTEVSLHRAFFAGFVRYTLPCSQKGGCLSLKFTASVVASCCCPLLHEILGT